jgi:hypothetical protein
MALPFRLIAVGLLVVALLFTIVAAATRGWVVAKGGGFGLGDLTIGLFTSCNVEGCKNTLDFMVDVSDSCTSRERAAQAFIVLAILALAPLLTVIVTRRFLTTSPMGVIITSKVSPTIDVIVAVIVALCLTIAWGAMANAFNECVCDLVFGWYDSCALGYSFALAIIAWIAVLGAAVMLFLGRNEGSGYSDVSAPLPN